MKQISRRDFLRVTSVTLGAATLAACTTPTAPAPAASGENPPAPAAQPAAKSSQVELTWLSHIYEPWNNALSALAMQYMSQNPDVKIVYSSVLHADLNAKIVTALEAKQAPTIMGIYGPWMPQLVGGNQLAAATDDVIADLDANFPAVMKESATYDGKVYGYVQHIGIPLPIINTDLYEQGGVQPPTTYDELLAANDKLNKKDGDTWSQFGTTLASTKSGSWNVIDFSALLFSYGGTYLTDDLKQAAFNSDAGMQAAEIYAQLAHADAPSEADLFSVGKTAMIWSGPWQKSSIVQTNPNLKFKALLPMKGSAGQVQGSYMWFWAVSQYASPEEQKAAWDFLKWLSAPEQYAAVYRNVGLLPITKKLPDELKDDEWAQTYSEGLNYARIYYAKHKSWEQIDMAIGEELERLVAGETKPDEFLQTAESKVNAVLSA